MNADFQLNGKIIYTARLVLRPFTLDDLTDFNEYASVPGVGEMAGWHHHETLEKSLEILRNFIQEDKTFAIIDNTTGKVIGSLGIEKYGMEDKLTEFDGYLGRELGFVLSKDFWGRGLVAEAVKAVACYLFEELDYDFLLCGHFNCNSQSKRVQQKCGFVPYRSLVMETQLGTKEQSTLNILLNPNKKLLLQFPHPETLIYKG